MKIAIIMFSISVIGIVVALLWTNSKGTKINSFWDVVRNPDAMPDLDQFHKDVEETASAISGSEEEIRRLVDFFVFDAKSSDEAWTEKRIIAKLGEKAYPRALGILRDESTHERLVVLSGDGDSLPEAPICRLAEIFDQNAPPPPEAAELLSRFLRSESAEIRKSVALIIGSIGSARTLPDLERALKDEDEYVKSYALMGIQRAISGGRIDRSEKSVFYELVAGMWPEDTSFNVCDSIPRILLSLDRERAIERLLEPDLFTAKFEPVWRILSALAGESVEIPRARLLTLIDEASKEPMEYPMDSVLEEALSHLGRHRVGEDLPTLERLVDHPNEDVSRGAIKGLYFHHRYFEVIRNPWNVVEADGWDALTEAEKHICAIEELDAEVNNGGFAQYYFNSTGNHWKDALDGLKAIGATKRHEMMVATIERFGQPGPPSNRDARNARLSKIVRKKEDPFNEQDSAWYQTDDEPLDRLMFRYNLANMKGRRKGEQNGAEQSAAVQESKREDQSESGEHSR